MKKFRVWDKNIPTAEEVEFGGKASGAMIDNDYVLKSSYLVDALNGQYPIMQFTGLQDKNGTDIYEGDIMSSGECVWDNSGKSAIMEVVYTPPRYECRILNKSKLGGLYVPSFTELQHSIYEVIGNKFENHELSEDKSE